MPLSVGDRIGPYEILAPIGKGGMGEVYQARDTKLDRDVAIKILPERLGRDPERLARFEREAKVLASLNHPNIAQIYGLEDRAIVMELVEGPTLADRLQYGAIALEESLKIASQIADALAAAHERGIVHRDLKPANVKVREDGTVKVLDFGLATAVQSGAREPGNGSNSPTLTMGATEPGVIMGTAAYMSPEQARGQKVDKRADIWSFGVVLYEMVTGKRLFEGATASDVLAQVLTKEPDLDRTPTKVRRLLRRCFEKDPKQRLRDIGEAPFLLDEIPESAPAPSRSQFGIVGWVAAGLLAVVGSLALWAPWRSTRPTDQPLVRLDVDLGPDVRLGAQGTPNAVFSPDGTRLVYASQGRLFTRKLDQPKATELVGTTGATSPFFSPDGQWVAFFAQGSLKKTSVEGGAALTLSPAGASFTGGSWGEDGNIIAALAIAGPLSRIPADGGTPTPVTELDRERREVTHRWPQILPGGKAVLFTANTQTADFDGATIEVMSFKDRRRKTLQRGGTYGRYLPSGHLVYLNRGTLFAVPFDLDTLAVRGTPVPVLNQVGYGTLYGSGDLDISRNGTLVYRSGEGAMLIVQWLDSAGKTQPLQEKPGPIFWPRLSPDGQRLALTKDDGLWVYDQRRDTMTRLTFDGKPANSPVWSPDGRYVVFESQGRLFWTRADGGGKPQLLLTDRKNVEYPWSFTPDGKRLAYNEVAAGNDLWTIPVEFDGTGLRAGKPELFLQTPSNESFGAFSPDGRWMAYASDESGAYEIYVRAFPNGGKWQVSNGGGLHPHWSSNGHELFFRSIVENQIMVAAYTVKGDSFAADRPRVWSEKRLAPSGLLAAYDLAPDGKHVAALLLAEAPGEQQAQSHVIFLQNFFDELRRRVPTSGR